MIRFRKIRYKYDASPYPTIQSQPREETHYVAEMATRTSAFDNEFVPIATFRPDTWSDGTRRRARRGRADCIWWIWLGARSWERRRRAAAVEAAAVWCPP